MNSSIVGPITIRVDVISSKLILEDLVEFVADRDNRSPKHECTSTSRFRRQKEDQLGALCDTSPDVQRCFPHTRHWMRLSLSKLYNNNPSSSSDGAPSRCPRYTLALRRVSSDPFPPPSPVPILFPSSPIRRCCVH